MVKTILIINIIVAFIIRAVHGGKMEIYLGSVERGSTTANYRLAGINSQPSTAFQYVKLPAGSNFDVCYSPLGFNAKRAGRQLTEFSKMHYASEVNIFAVSVGTQVMLDTGGPLYQSATKVAINPCLGRASLRPDLQKLVPVGAVLAEAINLALGCIALLPIIPAEGDNHYSVALWADLLWSIAFGETDQLSVDCVIWSSEDEMLDKTAVLNGLVGSSIDIYTIDSWHAKIGDPAEAPKYQEALDAFFQPPTK